MLILDFYNLVPLKREYYHYSGLFTHKMDYRKLFMWNPSYSSYTHKVRKFLVSGYTDDLQEWVAISVLRKNTESGE